MNLHHIGASIHRGLSSGWEGMWAPKVLYEILTHTVCAVSAHLLLLQIQAETITMIALTIRIPVTVARTGTTILTRTFLMW